MLRLLLTMIYLPLVLNQPANAQSTVGGYWYGVPRVEYLVPRQWVKIDSRWETTEPLPYYYDWTYLDAAVHVIRANNDYLMINVHNTPAWARTTRYKCKLPDDWRYLERFIRALINRYHPEAIELWNEPEMDAETSASLQYCCGCLDPHEYRQITNLIYSNVFQDTETLLIAGGLLMDHEWIDEMFSYPVQADAISFHHYNYGWDTSTWRLSIERGYLQGKTTAPVWLTETSLLCDGVCAEPFRSYQAAWFENVSRMDFPLVLWYAQNNVGWRNCNLVNEFTGTYYPAWWVLRNLLTDEY